jgi:hypothetical protein
MRTFGRDVLKEIERHQVLGPGTWRGSRTARSRTWAWVLSFCSSASVSSLKVRLSRPFKVADVRGVFPIDNGEDDQPEPALVKFEEHRASVPLGQGRMAGSVTRSAA